MANPVNRLTGDAPDGQNPNKKYVPTKEGSFKYTPPPKPKPDPKDAGIFTEEKLQRSGGKMKEPPMGLDSKKKGGVIKKRFARGGEIMDEVGMDPEEASSKATGLKASKGEDVGFFKRLMMGNIDKPGSEAYEKFGAGRGRVENMPAAPVREAIKRHSDDGFKPEPVKASDYSDRGENLKDTTGTIKYSSDYNSVKKESVKQGKKPVRVVKDLDGEAKEGPAVQLAADKMDYVSRSDTMRSKGRPGSISESDKPKPPVGSTYSGGSLRGYGEIANLNTLAERDKKSKEMMKDVDERDAFKRRVSSLSGGFKSGGATKAYAQGGSVSSRGDGCAQRGKTRGKVL
jgi:hypothetical protein